MEELLTKFVGYGPQYNEWLIRKNLKMHWKLCVNGMNLKEGEESSGNEQTHLECSIRLQCLRHGV